jgi:hypothetical protein
MFWEPLDVRRWTLATREQIVALERAFHRHYAHVIDSAGKARGPSEQGLRAEASAHFLAVSACHLAKALLADSALSRHYDRDLFEKARTLRNVLEHWDETRPEFAKPEDEATRSVKAYKAAYPDCTPWSMRWSPPEGIVVGEILQLEPLKAVVAALQTDLDADVRAALDRTGRRAGAVPSREIPKPPG